MLSTRPLPFNISSLVEFNGWLKSLKQSLASNREIPDEWLNLITAHRHSDGTPLGCIMMHTPWLQKKGVNDELILTPGTPFLAQRLVGICAPICRKSDPSETFICGPMREGTLVFMTDEVSDAGPLAI